MISTDELSEGELKESIEELRSIMDELGGDCPLRKTLRRLVWHLIRRENSRLLELETRGARSDFSMRCAINEMNAIPGLVGYLEIPDPD